MDDLLEIDRATLHEAVGAARLCRDHYQREARHRRDTNTWSTVVYEEAEAERYDALVQRLLSTPGLFDGV